jgi:hypothetical protein
LGRGGKACGRVNRKCWGFIGYDGGGGLFELHFHPGLSGDSRGLGYGGLDDLDQRFADGRVGCRPGQR